MQQRIRLTWVLLFYGGMTAAAFLWGWAAGRPDIWLHPASDVKLDLPLHIGIGVAASLLLIITSSLAREYFPFMRRLEDLFLRALGKIRYRDALLLAVASAISEESFFRGAMQPTLGLVLTSLIFGFVHVGPTREYLPWTIFALIVGLLLGWLFEYTGNLAAPVTVHFLVNLTSLASMAHRASKEPIEFWEEPEEEWKREMGVSEEEPVKEAGEDELVEAEEKTVQEEEDRREEGREG